MAVPRDGAADIAFTRALLDGAGLEMTVTDAEYAELDPYFPRVGEQADVVVDDAGRLVPTHLERLRLVGDEPVAVDRSWLPERFGAPLLDADCAECRTATGWT